MDNFFKKTIELDQLKEIINAKEGMINRLIHQRNKYQKVAKKALIEKSNKGIIV